MWQEPKTDWTVNDYFNYTDYNRIKNNIAYLREQALKLYINFPFTEIGVDKDGYSDFPYAEEFNAMEDNLESLKNNTYAFYEHNISIQLHGCSYSCSRWKLHTVGYSAK